MRQFPDMLYACNPEITFSHIYKNYPEKNYEKYIKKNEILLLFPYFPYSYSVPQSSSSIKVFSL